ncbi:MAG: hypothetical protein QOG77_2954, partial [Solirubrobacteraceae bacterium]|nr:hypothetical protein [Solirubrobacteraceae bacterium]
AGAEFAEHAATAYGAAVLRPARKEEPKPKKALHLSGIRQRIESIFWTLKDHLGLEQHRARTLHGLRARIASKLLAYSAGTWLTGSSPAPAAASPTSPPNQPWHQRPSGRGRRRARRSRAIRRRPGPRSSAVAGGACARAQALRRARPGRAWRAASSPPTDRTDRPAPLRWPAGPPGRRATPTRSGGRSRAAGRSGLARKAGTTAATSTSCPPTKKAIARR